MFLERRVDEVIGWPRIMQSFAPVLFATILLLQSSAATATAIDDKYNELGGAQGFLSAATGEEAGTSDNVGRVRMFSGGAIYWHPSTGAHEVQGKILKRYMELGGARAYLGYPMSDELESADRGGRVSKFQGGELIWHASTNLISEVKSTDLVVELPFPPGEAWYVIQANAVSKNDSHSGPWVYCWDFMLAGHKQTESDGLLFVAAADGPLVHVDQDNASEGTANLANVIVQRWGPGRYGSYLHLRKDSFSRHFGNGRPSPQSQPWAQRPIARSGETLAEVGDVGAPVGAFHLHFCVTTKPDRPQFAPFESVPVAFRNFSVSDNNGRSWMPVIVGVPKRGQWIRRERNGALSAPQVNDAAATISFGTVKGHVSFSGGQPASEGGRVNLTVQSKWGEPLVSRAIPLATDPAGIWTFEIADVPAFGGMKVLATYQGRWNGPASAISGESNAFDLRPSGVAAVDIQLGVGVPPARLP